jgi:hypothetical protein
MQQKYWNQYMTEDDHINGHNEEAEFERQDLAPRSILIFFLGLAVVCLLVLFLLRGMYRYLDTYEYGHEPPQDPLVLQPEADTRSVTPSDIATFPQPRLESNERLEINDFRVQEEKTLNSYGWVDQQTGVVRIPIERAMQLLVQRGLPTRPQAGALPLSNRNAAREADRPLRIPSQPARKK